MSSSSLYLPAATLKVGSIVDLPGSKSISNRVLLLAALANNDCHIRSLLQADDVNHMIEALTSLGVRITPSQQNKTDIYVQGCHGTFPIKKAKLFLGNAGTVFRPLTAVLAILGGDYCLSGIARMHERPISDLVDALRMTGASIDYIQQAGYPPLHIGQRNNTPQHNITIKGNISSQFLTALLMALPLTEEAYTVHIQGALISKPYIDITLKLMKLFGVTITHQNYLQFHIPVNACYHAPNQIIVEGDASSASYFLAAGLITGRSICINGIGINSIQGDIAFIEELAKIGATVTWKEHCVELSRDAHQDIMPFDIDANHIPDAAMTLAIIALSTKQPCVIRNIGSWRVKETDRVAAMATELQKLGARIVVDGDDFHIIPPAKLTPNVLIHTYNDHRMAMCFSLISLMGAPVFIHDPQCVNKTFPDYFSVLSKICEHTNNSHPSMPCV